MSLGFLLTDFRKETAMKAVKFSEALMLIQLNGGLHQILYTTTARNARRLEKKRANKQRVGCTANTTQTKTEKEQ